MMLDVEAVSHDKLYRLRPCVCGCRSFHLDDQMNWQCSRCKPPRRGAVRFELDDEPSPTSDQGGKPVDFKEPLNAPPNPGIQRH